MIPEFVHDDPDDHSDALAELAASLGTMPCVLAADVHRDTPMGDWMEVCVGEAFVPSRVLAEIARAGMSITGIQPQSDVASIVNIRETHSNP